MAAGALLLSAGVVLATLSLPAIVDQERAVVAYEELSEEKGSDAVPKRIDWDGLLATNPSLVAWCRVEGTSIDLPVCEATDDAPTHWLTHDFWGEDSSAGTPYVDHRASPTSQHILCYGHHLMGVGGMFSDVYRCHEQDEFDRWLTGSLVWSTPDGTVTRLRPLCASSQDMDHADIQRFEFDGTAGFRSWLYAILAQASSKAPDADFLAGAAWRAITLVTCSSDLSDQRERTLVTFVI